MNEQSYPSSQVMIQIDGARIRAIREAKGFTQLYIATAVDVTTDTVSRWENRRYPTIKKENGLKLAEALEVDLEEILDSGDGAAEAIDNTEPPAPGINPSAPEADTGDGEESAGLAALVSRPRWYSSIGHLTIVITSVLLICGALVFYRMLNIDGGAADISVTRIISPHFIAGQPLPIFLHIDKPDEDTVSVILKESLPPGASLESALPGLSGSSETEIKWLTKLSHPALFFYTVVTTPTFSGDLHFSGVVKNGSDDRAVAILGDTRSTPGSHHWADTDRDNRISDEEILVIYDLLADNSGQIINLDQLEEMWLGEGYVWNPDQQSFTIID